MINLILESVADGGLRPSRAQEKLQALLSQSRISTDQFAQACEKLGHREPLPLRA